MRTGQGKIVEKEPSETSDEFEYKFVSLGTLLMDRKISVLTLVAAIEKYGVYTHDRFDHVVFAKPNAEAHEKALGALERQHEWESEWPMHRGTVQSPVDEWGDAWHTPYARSGWPTDKCPNFETLGPSRAVGEVVGKMPAHVSDTKNWVMVVQIEAARRWAELRKAGANPTKHALRLDLAKWCQGQGIKTKMGINPSAQYIYRHALRKWNPPKD